MNNKITYKVSKAIKDGDREKVNDLLIDQFIRMPAKEVVLKADKFSRYLKIPRVLRNYWDRFQRATSPGRRKVVMAIRKMCYRVAVDPHTCCNASIMNLWDKKEASVEKRIKIFMLPNWLGRRIGYTKYWMQFRYSYVDNMWLKVADPDPWAVSEKLQKFLDRVYHEGYYHK